MGVFSPDRIRRGLESPNLFLRELNRLYYKRLYMRQYNSSGIDIFEEDWDNLLVLDACRYDMFERHSNLDGKLESRISRGSSTPEWLRANFEGRELHDTVYVTANPKLYEHRDEVDVTFHDVVKVWQDGWDDAHKTVLPETTTEYALEAAERYPEKRLLVHYVQPHYPFIGTNESPFDNEQAFVRPNEPGSWHQMMTGRVDATREEIWNAYVETLKRTIPAVHELLTGLNGKSVVSSDHGNMVGERVGPFPIREWGHPNGIYSDHLVTVPWLIQENNSRRTITADSPVERSDGIEDDVVTERLKHLGYAE